MAWRIGVDVGGTFTDLAAVDEVGGAVRLEKVPTTRADQSIGVAAGLTKLLGRHGVSPAAVTDLGQSVAGIHGIRRRPRVVAAVGWGEA